MNPFEQDRRRLPAIEAVGLEKSFGRRPVLRGVDLRVLPGERLALFGPNGAGKTTLLRTLATLTRPTAGRARVAGFDVVRSPDAVRSRIGVVGHQPLLYGDLTAAENLVFYARLYGLDEPGVLAAAGLARFGLADRAGDRVRTFSRGMQQRLALARATLHAPPILLLDEPDTGLDEAAGAMLADLLARRPPGPADGVPPTVVTATHNLQLGWELADRCAILVGGRIVWTADKKDRSFDELKAAYQTATRGVTNC